MNLEKCPKCGVVCYLPYTVTDISSDGSHKTIKVCSHCVKEFTIEDYQQSDFVFINCDVVHVQTSDELFALITNQQPLNVLACKCGTTENDLDRGSRLGCPECYKTFENKLKVIFKNYHGSNTHVGKIPKNASIKSSEDQLKLLKLQYAKALELEEYEKCADLKKKIDQFK
jgi:protein-arginine kinase activator protein McsA